MKGEGDQETYKLSQSLPWCWLLGDNINQVPPASTVSLIKGTEEWPGDYYPGKLLIGKSHWRCRARLSQEERGSGEGRGWKRPLP